MAVEWALLPSEISRLVYGFLLEENCKKTAAIYLSECPNLEECRYVVSQGKHFVSTHHTLALTEILEKFCQINEIVQKQVEKSNKLNGVKKYNDIVVLIKLLFEESKIQQLHNSSNGPFDFFNKPSDSGENEKATTQKRMSDAESQTDGELSQIQNSSTIESFLRNLHNRTENSNTQKRSIGKSKSLWEITNLNANYSLPPKIPKNSIIDKTTERQNKNVPNDRCTVPMTNNALESNDESSRVVKNSLVQVPETETRSKIIQNKETDQHCENTEAKTFDEELPNPKEPQHGFNLSNKNAALELGKKIAGNGSTSLEKTEEARDSTQNHVGIERNVRVEKAQVDQENIIAESIQTNLPSTPSSTLDGKSSNQPDILEKPNNFTEAPMEHDGLLKEQSAIVPKQVDTYFKEKIAKTPTCNLENKTNDTISLLQSPNVHVKSASKSNALFHHSNTLTSTPIKTMTATSNYSIDDWFSLESFSPNLDIVKNSRPSKMETFTAIETVATASKNLASSVVMKEKVTVSCSYTNTVKDKTLHTPDLVIQQISKVPNNAVTSVATKASSPQPKTPVISEKSSLMLDELLKPGGTVESISPLLKDINGFNYNDLEPTALYGHQAAVEDPVIAPETETNNQQSLDDSGLHSFLKTQKKTEEKDTAVVENNKIVMSSKKTVRLPAIPEESIEGGSENNSTFARQLEAFTKNTPKAFAQNQTRDRRCSSSTPKKPNNHIRALDFDDPYGRSRSDSKCNNRQVSLETLLRPLKSSSCKSFLFKSPPESKDDNKKTAETKALESGKSQENKEKKENKSNDEKSTEQFPSKKRDEKGETDLKKTKVTSKTNWDEELRKYASLSVEKKIEGPPRRKHRKVEDPSMRYKKTKCKASTSKTIKENNETLPEKSKETESDSVLCANSKNHNASSSINSTDMDNPSSVKKGPPKPKIRDKSKPKIDKKISNSVEKSATSDNHAEDDVLENGSSKTADSKVKTLNNEEITKINVESKMSKSKDTLGISLPEISHNENAEKVLGISLPEISQNENAEKVTSIPENLQAGDLEDPEDPLEVLLSDKIEVHNESDVIRLASEEMKMYNTLENNQELVKLYDEVSKNKSIIQKMQVDEANMTAMFSDSAKNANLKNFSVSQLQSNENTSKVNKSPNTSVDCHTIERQLGLNTPKATTPKAEVIYDEVSKIECGRIVQKKYARIKTLDTSDLSDESRHFQSSSITKDFDEPPLSVDESTMNSAYRKSEKLRAQDTAVIDKSLTPRELKISKTQNGVEKKSVSLEEAIQKENPQEPKKLVATHSKPVSPCIEDSSSMTMTQKPRTPCVLSPGSNISLNTAILKVNSEDSHTISAPVPNVCPPTPKILLTPENSKDKANHPSSAPPLPSSPPLTPPPPPSPPPPAVSPQTVTIEKSDVTQFEVVKENLLKNLTSKSQSEGVEKTDTLNLKTKEKVEVEHDLTNHTTLSSSSSSSNCSTCRSSSSSSSSEEESDSDDESRRSENKIEKRTEETKVHEEDEMKAVAAGSKSETSPAKVMPIHKTDLELADSMKETPARDENAEIEIHETPNVAKPMDNPTNLSAKFSQMMVQKECNETVTLSKDKAKPKIIKIEHIMTKVVTVPSLSMQNTALPSTHQQNTKEPKPYRQKLRIKIEKNEQEIKQAVDSIIGVQTEELNEITPETPIKTSTGSSADLLDSSGAKQELVQAIESITKVSGNDSIEALANNDISSSSSDNDLMLVVDDNYNDYQEANHKTVGSSVENPLNPEPKSCEKSDDEDSVKSFGSGVLGDSNNAKKEIYMKFDESTARRRRRKNYREDDLTMRFRDGEFEVAKWTCTKLEIIYEEISDDQKKKSKKRKAPVVLADDDEGGNCPALKKGTKPAVKPKKETLQRPTRATKSKQQKCEFVY
ncbi:protein piccolo [Copidosoma floridanum]|uniref:protein piccolo n=1 Tax=Copidosoma floridanum TaxID=29053 RepID=UPI0006C94BAB|nr:protein piccolo [Copidosoma floridanum]